MSDQFDENISDFDKLSRKVEYLETRISQLEAVLGVIKPSEHSVTEHSELHSGLSSTENSSDSETVMESHIGEFGLAWLGSIVLLFGIAFLTQYIQSSGQPVLSAVFGYCAVITVFIIAHFIKKSFANLSSKFNILSYILLFYVTLRLHFFTAFPVIQNEILPLILLVIIIGIQFFLSYKHKSQFLGTIAVILLLITAAISQNNHIMFILVSFVAAISIFYLHHYGWWKLFLLTQFLVYISFLLWYFQTQTLPNPEKLPLSDHCTIVYLFICVSIFSMITLFRQKNTIPQSFVFISVFLNGIFFTLILATFIATFYATNYVSIFIPIAIICIAFSVVLKKYSEWKYTPAFYALYGFVALSTAVYGIYGLPLVFMLLSIQSLLVVSMAIWFRSRIIVVMNFGMYIMLLLTYQLTSSSHDNINFSFALIALITARIINWKKDRLTVQTDLLRNAYMVAGFFTMLFALYKVVPGNYVTLSWSIIAVIYFVLSILLHNIKYRWMAIFTMISTAFYLFIVDLARVGMVYRIVAFMFLAIISIGISLYYSKRKKHHSKPNES